MAQARVAVVLVCVFVLAPLAARLAGLFFASGMVGEQARIFLPQMEQDSSDMSLYPERT
jgi:hypothetical protein